MTLKELIATLQRLQTEQIADNEVWVVLAVEKRYFTGTITEVRRMSEADDYVTIFCAD